MKLTFLCIVALSLLLLVRDASPLGGSGLFGIDLGTDTFRVMTLSGNSPNIVLNDQSGRKSPSLVGFTREGERVFGSRAAQLGVKFPDRVISSAHQFLGKTFPDPEIEASRHLFTFQVVENKGFYAFQVDDTIYTPEEIVAMLIEFAHTMASEVARSKLTDCVITVPPHLTQFERQAYINAARIAGVNVALLATEGVSTAVDYLRSRLLTAEDLEQYTLFVDVGASHTSATLAQFQIQRMKDQSISRRVTANTTTWASVGGRDFDYKVTRLLQQKAEAQFGADFSENQRVLARLRNEARKAKEVLTVNKEARVRIESLHSDRDFSASITLEEFEEQCEDLIDRVMDPIRRLVETIPVPLEEVEVEVVGGGSRVVKINAHLLSIFGERVGRHLNGDEASLQGAMLYAASSSAGKRATVTVRDSINYSVDLKVDLPDINSTPLFSAASRLRTHKNKNVLAQDSFTFDIVYPSEEEDVEASLIASYEVSGFPNPDTYTLTAEDVEAEMPTVKLRFEIDSRGLIDCTEAAVRIEEAVPSTPTPSPSPSATPEAASEEAEQVEEDANEAGDAEPEQDAVSDDVPPSEEAEEPAQPEDADATATEEDTLYAAPTPVPTRKRIVPLTVKKTSGNLKQSSEEDIVTGRLLLARLTREDKTRRQREATKNDIEAYVYATLDLLEQDEIRAVSTEEEIETLSNALMEAGDWIYDDGSDATLEEYEAKLYSLKSVGDRIVLRRSEAENRPKVAAAFHEWKQLAMDSLKDIVTERMVREEEQKDLVSDIESAEVWLEEQQELQSALQSHEDPAWLTSDLLKKIQSLQKTLERLQRRRIRTPTPSPTPKPSRSEEAAEKEEEGDILGDIDFDNLNFDTEENAPEIPEVDVEEEEPIPLGEEGSQKKPGHEEL